MRGLLEAGEGAAADPRRIQRQMCDSPRCVTLLYEEERDPTVEDATLVTGHPVIDLVADELVAEREPAIGADQNAGSDDLLNRGPQSRGRLGEDLGGIAHREGAVEYSRDLDDSPPFARQVWQF